jgi:hypothetical protein
MAVPISESSGCRRSGNHCLALLPINVLAGRHGFYRLYRCRHRRDYLGGVAPVALGQHLQLLHPLAATLKFGQILRWLPRCPTIAGGDGSAAGADDGDRSGSDAGAGGCRRSGILLSKGTNGHQQCECQCCCREGDKLLHDRLARVVSLSLSNCLGSNLQHPHERNMRWGVISQNIRGVSVVSCGIPSRFPAMWNSRFGNRASTNAETTTTWLSWQAIPSGFRTGHTRTQLQNDEHRPVHILLRSGKSGGECRIRSIFPDAFHG